MALSLDAYLQAQAAREFTWNTCDCASFAFGWCDALTGACGLASWSGLYHDADSCASFITKGGGFAAIADQFLKQHYAASPCAKAEGLVVLCQYQKRRVMGLRVNKKSISFKADHGLIVTTKARVLREWGLQCRKY